MANAREVAEWMAEQVMNGPYLVQRTAARTIRHQFGEEFVYRNDNRNWAISPEVLKEFDELTTDTVKWVRGRRVWRKAKPGDPPGREVAR